MVLRRCARDDRDRRGCRACRKWLASSCRAASSPAWPEIAYQVTRPDRLREDRARRDGCTVLRGLLDDPALTWFERLLVHEELVLQKASHGDGIVAAAALDAWSAAALDDAPTLPLRVARAGALAQQFAARLRIARAKAELAALRCGIDQVRHAAPGGSDGGSRTS